MTATPSVWNSAGPTLPYARLDSPASADVVVIGGGFSGLVAALELAEAGRSALLLEAGTIGDNASGASAGQLGPLFYGARKTVAQVDRVLGSERAARLHARVAAAGDWLFDLVAARDIQCEARRGFLCVYRSDKSLQRAIRLFDQWRPHGGVFEPVDARGVRRFVDSGRYAGGVMMPAGGFLNPAMLLAGLATPASRAGASIHMHSRVQQIERQHEGWTVRTDAGSVMAGKILVATGSAGLAAWPALARTVYAVPCGIAATGPMTGRDRSLLPADGPVADLDDKAVFAPAVTSDGRLLVSFLMNRDAPGLNGATPARWRLEKAFSDRTVPEFQSMSWGRLALTPDGLPRVIRGENGLFAVTGCNGFGLTLGILAAREAVRALLGAAPETLALPLTAPRALPLARVMPAVLRTVVAPLANRLGA